MRYNILGLGESLAQYIPDNNKTIGVNDIFKYHNVDYLVCIDLPTRFKKDRLKTILNSTPQKFFTHHYSEWRPLVNNLQGLNMSAGNDFSKLDKNDIIIHSNNSVFVACVLAYKMGATEIIIYGSDFNTHPNFDEQAIKTALRHFKNLYNELKKRGVNLFVCTSESKLSNVLPIWKPVLN